MFSCRKSSKGKEKSFKRSRTIQLIFVSRQYYNLKLPFDRTGGTQQTQNDVQTLQGWPFSDRTFSQPKKNSNIS